MPQLKTLLRFPKKTSSKIRNTAQSQNKSKGWWTPLWKGLVSDAESRHRKKMGAALWLYLYLLTCASRKTGAVYKKQVTMARETGYPLRSLQRHLRRLVINGYIRTENQPRLSTIYITKWKLFSHDTSYDNKSAR